MIVDDATGTGAETAGRCGGGPWVTYALETIGAPARGWHHDQDQGGEVAGVFDSFLTD